MPKDYSPFTPGLPVPIEFFVGRTDEIQALREKVERIQSGRMQNAFLIGERGIGKSSLASFVKHLVEKKTDILSISTSLGGVKTLNGMVEKVFDRLVKESYEKPWYDKIASLFGDRIEKVGLFGVDIKFKTNQSELSSIVNDFQAAITSILAQLKEKKGLFLILDDINGLSESRKFADWYKSFVDQVGTSQKKFPVCILFVGLEERRQSLIKAQPSLARVFDLFEIKAWSNIESAQFFKNAFGEVSIELSDEALDLMTDLTGGLPVLAHEIGESVFKEDDDDFISRKDAIEGAITAAEIVGQKYLEPQVLGTIRSGKYFKILEKVGRPEFGLVFSRKEVLKVLSKTEEKVFDNFLKKMRDLGVIVSYPTGGPGWYRFRNRLHYGYFYLEADKTRQRKQQ